MAHILYLTYDGLLDPLGQSQICPYIRELARLGFSFTVISFEKDAQYEVARTMPADSVSKLLGATTTWIPLRYRKSPRTLGTALNILSATVEATRIGRPIDIVHLRSYVLGPVAMFVKRTRKSRFLFDIRGLWVQERVDIGSLRSTSAITRAMRWLEKLLFREADWTVTLTNHSLPAIRDLTGGQSAINISVIPTAVDLNIFYPTSQRRNQHPYTFGYSGSLGTWYDFNRIYRFAATMTGRGHFVRIATNTRDAELLQRLRMPNLRILHLNYSEVPKFINSCDAMFFFVVPHPSLTAMCPTKMGEALAAGRPIITGAGIGDVDSILEESGTGLILRSSPCSTPDEEGPLIEAFLNDANLSRRCVSEARNRFSLASACSEYSAIYSSLTSGEWI